jgi:hypothetical protein
MTRNTRNKTVQSVVAVSYESDAHGGNFKQLEN